MNLLNIGLTFNSGNDWETFCHSCLKMKHQFHNYKKVDAIDGGDYGLDGFTSVGDVYQCYCPEKEYSDKDLYEHLRDKVRDDITKLSTYNKDISKILNGIKIKTWHFTSPRILSTPQFISHCNKYENIAKAWGYPFIDKNFRIGFKDLEYFRPEIPKILHSYNDTIAFKPLLPENSLITDFKQEPGNNYLVNNALTKNSKLFPKDGIDYSSHIIKRTDLTIKSYLRGEDIRRKWSDLLDVEYERFLSVVSALEYEVELQSTLPIQDKPKKIEEFRVLIVDKLNKEFPRLLNEPDKEVLASSIIADWLMRCPLDFI